MVKAGFGMPKARKGGVVYLCPKCGSDMVMVRLNNKSMAVSCHKSAKKLSGQSPTGENYDAGCNVHMNLSEAEGSLQKKD